MDQRHSGLLFVFEENRQPLLRFLMARTRNAALAEDLLQNVWIKIQDLEHAQPVENPLAYLFKSCENAARDAKRSAARKIARETLWAEQDGLHVSGGQDNLTPEKIAMERDNLRAVLAELEKMPERTRAIFLDFRVQEIPQQEIADQYAISISAVEKHLQRAYRVIREYRGKMEKDDAGGAGP